MICLDKKHLAGIVAVITAINLLVSFGGNFFVRQGEAPSKEDIVALKEQLKDFKVDVKDLTKENRELRSSIDDLTVQMEIHQGRHELEN